MPFKDIERDRGAKNTPRPKKVNGVSADFDYGVGVITRIAEMKIAPA
jgi:hypothetical protein